MQGRHYGLCKICGCYYSGKTGRRIAIPNGSKISGAVPGFCFTCRSIKASGREYREDGSSGRTVALFLGFVGFASLSVVVLLVLFAAIMRAI